MNFARTPVAQPAMTDASDVTATLRLLETTDLHANVLPYDYFAGLTAQPYGLARTATLIRAARRECPNTMLFDNGDALQGTPLADITAQAQSGWAGPHPMIDAMNLLDYDAATVGNHEFNFGLDWLQRTLTNARFPVTCANLFRPDGAPLLPPFLMLDRMIEAGDGSRHPIRIGVLGLAPPQVTIWDHYHLQGRLVSRCMIETARQALPRLRAAGADLVVILAHTGIRPGPARPMMENAALQLAGLGGVDAILTGHTHGVFPGSDIAPGPGIDPVAGTLRGVPAVMAGFRGSHLGMIDLRLQRRGGRWHVLGHRVQALPVAAPAGSRQPAQPAPMDRPVARALGAAHRMTVRLTAQPIGHCATPLHSYLAMARCNAAVRMVTQAQRAALRDILRGTPEADLPILSASAPFKTGGRAGPMQFTDIPAGQLSLRNAADLCPFPNTLCGLRVTGADLRDWLERAAICFNQIQMGAADQMLCNPAVPGHDFDTIDGLSYVIDLTQPARHALDGSLRDADAQRIVGLSYRGTPVRDTDRFILATNSYRAFGGGPFRALPADAFVHVGKVPVRQIIARHMQAGSTPATPTWRFAAMPGTRVLLDTGPGVRHYGDDLTAIGAEDCGDTPDGFARLRIPL